MTFFRMIFQIADEYFSKVIDPMATLVSELLPSVVTGGSHQW